ncbi:MAG TPA: HAD family hydrolase [Candidatus Binatia bacterium]|jgi:D-glycero-D-manno-heptose 1,7-bisphosphate phosphatase|nr:HAD family hydrolase [Candidatus Binatia bacterium]
MGTNSSLIRVYWWFAFGLILAKSAYEFRMNQAVFLDRDGTLIEEKHYLSRPEDVVLFPGAGAALKRLQDSGFKLFIVSNQSGVGRGYFTMAEVERVNRRLSELLAQFGAVVEKIYVAPEAPDTPSRGRKPSPQFLFDARDEFGVELAQSYMIGDKLIDLECGWNAGAKRCVLVRTGYGAEQERTFAAKLASAIVADDVAAAAAWILAQRATPAAVKSVEQVK